MRLHIGARKLNTRTKNDKKFGFKPCQFQPTHPPPPHPPYCSPIPSWADASRTQGNNPSVGGKDYSPRSLPGRLQISGPCWQLKLREIGTREVHMTGVLPGLVSWAPSLRVGTRDFCHTSARNYRPCFRENKPKTLVFYDWKRAFWACFCEYWVYKFGHLAALVSPVQLTSIFCLHRQASWALGRQSWRVSCLLIQYVSLVPPINA